MGQSRREFLKIAGLGFGAVAFSAPLINWANGAISTDRLPGEDFISRTPTYCEICFWKCAGWVYKNETNDIWKIIGNDDDQHCNGRLCPRGTGGVGMYYDEDRLKTPLIRKTIDGKQQFVEASWEEALSLVAENLKKLKDSYGPESVALFTHGSGGKFFGDLLNAYGSTTVTAPSFAQCRGPREVAFTSTFGEVIASPERTDIRDTKCLVLIGSHIGENMHNGQVQEMSDAIDKGATIITVDPRFSTAASKSKYWLPIKPATDIALLLSWIHEIIYNEWYDKKYVEKYCYGFDELKEHVKTFTPEWAYGITTIKPHVIRETAKEMANASPAVIVHPGRHVTWYGDDTQRLRAVAILNALLGSWGRRGGFYNPDRASLPSYHHPEFPKPSKTWRDAHPGLYNLANEVVANDVCDSTIPKEGRPFNIKGWIVNGTNLISTLPDQRKTMQAIQNLDFMVVIDTMPMEITGYADVVLPECTYLERYDYCRTDQNRQASIALRMPATAPKYDSKPSWWIVKELSKKMQLEQYFQWNNMEELLDWQLKQVGSSLEEMQRIGVKNIPRTDDYLYSGEGEDIEFNTNTGKIELFATDLQNEGFDPLPVYTPHPEPQPQYYRLNYGRNPAHTFSRTSNNPNLTELFAENVLWINPIVAKEWDLKPAQAVWLENQDGIVSTNSIKVRITERIRPDSVYMVHGFGHTDKRLSRAAGKGVSDTEMITNVMTDPIMGGTGMRGNFVTLKLENPHNNKKEVAS